MTIGLSAKKSEFTEGLWKALEEKLKGETLVWMDEGNAAEVEVLLAMGPVKREQMEAMKALKLIQTLSDGYDAVDVEGATELGIYVSYSPGDETGNADSVAEYAVMMMLAAGRRVGEAVAAMREGKASRKVAPSLAGKTVLIAGLGDIGTKVAARLRPFEVMLRGVDREPQYAPKDVPTRPLEELKGALGEADYVVICLRGSDSNEHLFDADMLNTMKEGAALVNIARGSIVDGKALAAAVKSGRIVAGIDVVEDEPVKPGNPLLHAPGVFLTPHLAGFTDLTMEGTAVYVAEVVRKFRNGEKITSVLNEPEKPRGVVKH